MDDDRNSDEVATSENIKDDDPYQVNNPIHDVTP